MKLRKTFKQKLCILFILIASNISGQDISLRQLTTEDGMPENTGQTILQDREGFVWIGTQNGLAKYDGLNFKVYKHDAADTTSVSNNQIEDLVQDEAGYIWVATRNGLNRFDPVQERFTRFFPDQKGDAGRNWFRSVQPDHQGNLWAISYHGLYHIKTTDHGPIDFYGFPNQNTRYIGDIAIAKDGKIWVSANDSLYNIQNGHLQFNARLPLNIISILDQNEHLLLATSKGLMTWHKSTGRLKQLYSQHLDNVFCLNLYKDKAGKLWVLTSNGVYVFDNDEMMYHFKQNQNGPNRLSNNLVLDVLEDSEGLIWIGTGKGVNIFDPAQNKFLRISNQSKGPIRLPERQVEAIHFSDSVTLWLASRESLAKITFQKPQSLSVIHTKNWPVKATKTYTSARYPLLKNDNIDIISNAEGGGIFIGTRQGKLLHLDANDSMKRLNSYRNYQQLRGLYQQPGTSLLWCGASDGLYVYDVKTDTSFIPNWLPDIDVVQLGIFQKELWIGTPQGLYVVDPIEETWRTYTPQLTEGKLPNTMLTHSRATDSVLWFTTFGGGLVKYSPKRDLFKAYSENDGLVNTNVWSVYPDKNGKLWLSTDNGVASFNLQTETFKNYNKKDGLNYEDFSLTAHAQSPSGELWFGNPEGLTVFHPDNLSPSKHKPLTRISAIEINYEAHSDFLKQYKTTNTLVLKPEDQTVTFSLAAMSFRDPENNRLAYKLEGYDQDWVFQPASQQKVTYTSLPHGNYTFHAKSATKSGLWGNELIVDLEVIPPFYKTLWFRSLILILLIVIISLLTYLYNRNKYLKQIKAFETRQKIQNERERISKDLHDHVGAHLTRIITDLDVLSIQMDTASSQKYLDKIEDTRNFTHDTIQLLRDTIWAINKDSYWVKEFAEKCEAFLEKYLGDFLEWKVECYAETERNLSPNQVLNLLRVLQEATQNMLKYANATQFSVQIISRDKLHIRISDNGIGMTKISEPKNHYGLRNMKDRITEIDGNFEIRSSPSNGLRIYITLPA